MYEAMFPRLLGLPDGVVEITYYDYLGISPDEVTPEALKQALKARRAFVRRNMKNPKLMPVIFELEAKLREAYETLSRPGRRKAYDARLHVKKPEAKAEGAEEQLQALLKKSRRAIRRVRNPDRTLDPDKREPLIAELCQIGLDRRQAEELIKRHTGPRRAPGSPAKKAPQPENARALLRNAIEEAVAQGGGMLDPAAVTSLYQYGMELGLSAAEVERQLHQDHDLPLGHIGPVPKGQGPPPPSVPSPEPTAPEDEDMDELQRAIDEIEGKRPPREPEDLQSVIEGLQNGEAPPSPPAQPSKPAGAEPSSGPTRGRVLPPTGGASYDVVEPVEPVRPQTPEVSAQPQPGGLGARLLVLALCLLSGLIVLIAILMSSGGSGRHTSGSSTRGDGRAPQPPRSGEPRARQPHRPPRRRVQAPQPPPPPDSSTESQPDAPPPPTVSTPPEPAGYTDPNALADLFKDGSPSEVAHALRDSPDHICDQALDAVAMRVLAATASTSPPGAPPRSRLDRSTMKSISNLYVVFTYRPGKAKETLLKIAEHTDNRTAYYFAVSRLMYGLRVPTSDPVWGMQRDMNQRPQVIARLSSITPPEPQPRSPSRQREPRPPAPQPTANAQPERVREALSQHLAGWTMPGEDFQKCASQAAVAAACADYYAGLVTDSFDRSLEDKLLQALENSNPAEMLTQPILHSSQTQARQVSLSTILPSGPEAESVSEATIEGWKQDLSSTRSTVRAQAIRNLQLLDTDEAAEFLMKKLDFFRSRRDRIRLILALSHMSSPRIPPTLIMKLAEVDDRHVAFEIVQALRAMTGWGDRDDLPPDRNPFLLKCVHTEAERLRCAREWGDLWRRDSESYVCQNRYGARTRAVAPSVRYGYRQRLRNPSQNPTAGAPSSAAGDQPETVTIWQPSLSVRRLLTIWSEHLNAAGRLLKSRLPSTGAASSPSRAEPSRASPPSFPTYGIRLLGGAEGDALLSACDVCNTSLERWVRGLLRDRPDLAVQVDAEINSLNVQRVVCDTNLQRLATDYQKMAVLLESAILALDTKQKRESEVTETREEFTSSEAMTFTVLDQLSCRVRWCARLWPILWVTTSESKALETSDARHPATR